MRTLLLPVVAAAVLLPSVAIAAPAQHSFQRNGETYTYSVERQKDGAFLLVGEVKETGEAIHLNVIKNRVEGQMGLNTVSFRVPKSTTDRLAAELAAEQTAIAAN